MPSGIFLDTNVLLYAASGRNREPFKAPIALRLLAEGDICLSAQVLAEFYWNAMKARTAGLTAPQAGEWVERLAVFPCAEIDHRLVRSAILLSQRWRISYWDAAILAAAERLDAEVLYSEDLSHGQTYGSVRVENPFLAA